MVREDNGLGPRGAVFVYVTAKDFGPILRERLGSIARTRRPTNASGPKTRPQEGQRWGNQEPEFEA